MKLLFELQQTLRFLFRELCERHAGPVGHDFGDIALLHDRDLLLARPARAGFELRRLLDQRSLLAVIGSCRREILPAEGLLDLFVERGDLLIQEFLLGSAAAVLQAYGARGLIDEIDRLIRQVPVIDIALR